MAGPLTMRFLLDLPFRGPPDYDPRWDERAWEIGGASLYEPLHFDREGQPLTLRQWVMLIGDPEYERVAECTIANYRVRTVWLGLAPNLFGPRPFETTVSRSGERVDIRRYATEEEALAGHKRFCEQMRPFSAARRAV